MRASARALLGWEDVAAQLQNQDVDSLRSERLRRELRDARARLPQAIRQGCAVVVTVNENNDVHAFRLAAAAGPLSLEIKNDERSRINVAHDGWDEQYGIPCCKEATLEAALAQAVADGTVWLVNGPTSCWKETVPFTALDEQAELLPPPQMIAPQELTPDALPGAWQDLKTNGAAIVRALSQKKGVVVPWGVVRDSLGEAVRSRWLETVQGDGATAEFDRAGAWGLRVPDGGPALPPPPSQVANLEVESSQMQDLVESVPNLLEASAGYGLRFRVGVVLDASAPASVRKQVDDLLTQIAPDFKSDVRSDA